MAGVYQAFVVAMDGTQYGELVDATIGPISFELNGPGAVEVSLPTTAAAAAYPQFGREIQIWRDGLIIWWGPIVRPQIELWQATWGCAGLLWYLKHRFMGRADRVNLLTNGDFESGETGWTFNSVTHSADTAHHQQGTHAEKLIGAVTEGENWAKQIYTHTTASFPIGDFLTLNAWLYVQSSGYVAPAVGLRGLFCAHYNAANVLLDIQFTVLDDDTPQDQWVNFEVGMINVAAGDWLDIRLYAPNGTCWWDLATLTAMESLTFGYYTPVDLADIIADIVLYAQDRYVFTHGKSDLNIDTAGAATGILMSQVWQFVEHRNIADVIDEYVKSGYLDIDIAITATTRTFTTYAPRKGSYKSGDTLTLDTNIASFRWSFDGEAAADNVVVLGPGSGPARPEGGAIDTSLWGGLTVEAVDTAATDVAVGQLDDKAGELLRVGLHPEIVEATTYPHSALIGDLVVGDSVPVVIVHGCINITADYRIVKMTLDPATDQATYTLNPV